MFGCKYVCAHWPGCSSALIACRLVCRCWARCPTRPSSSSGSSLCTRRSASQRCKQQDNLLPSCLHISVHITASARLLPCRQHMYCARSLITSECSAGDNSGRCIGSRAEAAVSRLKALPDHQGRPQRGWPCCAAAVRRAPAGMQGFGFRFRVPSRQLNFVSRTSTTLVTVSRADGTWMIRLDTRSHWLAAPTGRCCCDGKVAPGAQRGSHVHWRAALQGAPASLSCASQAERREDAKCKLQLQGRLRACRMWPSSVMHSYRA